jgi:hypothetical protein
LRKPMEMSYPAGMRAWVDRCEPTFHPPPRTRAR